MSTSHPSGNLTEPPRRGQHAHYRPAQRRKPWPIRHKIWTAILSVIALIVILGIAGAVTGSAKTTGSAAAQTPDGSSLPQATRSAAAGPTHAQTVKKASAAAENACYKRPWAPGDIYVRMIVPGLSPQAQELGGEWDWNHVLNKCGTSV